MIYKSCCFTGHRIISDDFDLIRKEVYKNVQSLISQGTENFILGGAIGFDSLCAKIIVTMKKKYPKIRLMLILPCMDQDKKWNSEQKAEYRFILDNADSIKYISQKYITGCMHQRNREMVDNSDCVIAYCKRDFGGTHFTVSYAKSQKNKL